MVIECACADARYYTYAYVCIMHGNNLATVMSLGLHKLWLHVG